MLPLGSLVEQGQVSLIQFETLRPIAAIYNGIPVSSFVQLRLLLHFGRPQLPQCPMDVPSEACQNWCTHQADDDTVVGGDESTSYMLTGSNTAHDKEDCNSSHDDGDDEEIDPATVQVVIARLNDTHAVRRRHDLIHRFE